MKIPPEILIGAFLTTFAVYSLNNATDNTEDAINKPGSKPKNSKFYLASSIVALLVCIAIDYSRGWLTLLVLTAPLIIGFAYSIPIAKSIPRLKEILGIKSFVVALSWAVAVNSP